MRKEKTKIKSWIEVESADYKGKFFDFGSESSSLLVIHDFDDISFFILTCGKIL